MKLAGKVTTWAGSLVVIISLFLPYYHFVEGGSQSAWDLGTRGPLLFTLLAIAAVTLAMLTIFYDLPVLVVAQAALGLYLFGLLFPVGGKFLVWGGYNRDGVGFWLLVVGSLAMAVGGALSIAAIWPRMWRATIGWDVSSESQAPVTTTGLTPPRAPAEGPPPGWYPDPSRQGSQRYWSGTMWTERVTP
jgi:uncharacterized membrane protein